jgi:hypothetical protein
MRGRGKFKGKFYEYPEGFVRGKSFPEEVDVATLRARVATGSIELIKGELP